MPHKSKIEPRKYNTFYLKNLHNFLQTVNDKQALVSFRHNILSKQKAIEYQNESDRINGVLKHSILANTHPNYQRLKNRAEELKQLGAKAFDRILEN